MLPSLLGRKLGMTQIFGETGAITPVTVLECGPCPVLQVKTVDTDGYNAVQLGFGDGHKKNTSKPMLGHFKKANVEIPKRFVREIRLTSDENGKKIATELKIGDLVKVDIFEGTWKVDISGVTKGRGFSGMIKRWGKHRGPAGHGSMLVRGPGSLASDSRLTHIRVGKHMAGHYGVENVTTRHLELMKIDKERNLLFIKGSVPGATKGFVIVNKTTLVKPIPKVSAKAKKIEIRKKK
jgi:large subunit ribosomal protein L3